MIRASLVAAALLCAACSPANEPQPASPSQTERTAETMPQTADEATAQDTCGASAYRHLIDQNVAAVTLPEGVRTIGPDTVVTQDFRPDRLNVMLDAEGRIVDLRCY